MTCDEDSAEGIAVTWPLFWSGLVTILSFSSNWMASSLSGEPILVARVSIGDELRAFLAGVTFTVELGRFNKFSALTP
jgi:hypothetical protein